MFLIKTPAKKVLTQAPKVYNYTDSNPTGGSKFNYRLKQIDNDGAYEYSDIVEVEFVLSEFTLYQNYPNPFNPSTTIKFAIPKETRVSLRIYSVLGEEVTSLIDKEMKPGYYEVEFNASNFTSGVYLYSITAGDFIETKKMVILK